MLRHTLFAFAALCTLSLGVAHAKKVRFNIENCTSKALNVYTYNGDDGSKTFERSLKKLKAGKRKGIGCKVNSGKKRCFVKLQRNNSQASASIRVKNGRTLYITSATKVADASNRQGKKKTSIEYNTTGCGG